MSPVVEEFYNRVHGKGGRFSTSGTGGGHYKGRAAGAKSPSGSGKSGKAPPPPPPRTVKTKGTLAERLKVVTEKTSVKRKETLRRLADKNTAKTEAAKPKGETMEQRVARITKQRNESKAKAAESKKSAPAPAQQSAHDKSALDAINKVRDHKETGTKQAYVDAHKTEVHTAPAGPKPAQAKQDSKTTKAPLSKRVGGFLKKVAKASSAINTDRPSAASSDLLRTQRMQEQDRRQKKEQAAYDRARG